MGISKQRATVSLPLRDKPYPKILDFLAERFPRIERSVWEARIRKGKVLDDGDRPVSFDWAYVPQARLHYFREVEDEPRIPFEATVLYRDAHMLVADKPHFLPTSIGGRFVHETLQYRLQAELGSEEVVPLHRLDRETAGLVLFSLNPATRSRYHMLFQERRIEKTYEALSAKIPTGEVGEWTIANRLVKGVPEFRIQEEVGSPNAVSRIVYLGEQQGRARFRLFPQSGKKHQLRQHMASLGFPILNDRYYPELEDERPDDYERPLALLAKRLSFIDPVSGEERVFASKRSLLSS